MYLFLEEKNQLYLLSAVADKCKSSKILQDQSVLEINF